MWQWQPLLRLKDLREITGTRVRITKATTAAGSINGMMDNSIKETIHRMGFPILTELGSLLHAHCVTWSKRITYQIMC